MATLIMHTDGHTYYAHRWSHLLCTQMATLIMPSICIPIHTSGVGLRYMSPQALQAMQVGSQFCCLSLTATRINLSIKHYLYAYTHSNLAWGPVQMAVGEAESELSPGEVRKGGWRWPRIVSSTSKKGFSPKTKV